MLRLYALGILLGLTACADQKPHLPTSKVGWRSQIDRYRVSLFYDYGDNTRFAATCDYIPIFALSGGDYANPTGKFRLIVDDQDWEMETWAGHHGSILIVDDPKFADIFAHAKQRISFQVGDGWERSIKPTPQLAKFVTKCRAMRKVDPDADGIPGARTAAKLPTLP